MIILCMRLSFGIAKSNNTEAWPHHESRSIISNIGTTLSVYTISFSIKWKCKVALKGAFGSVICDIIPSSVVFSDRHQITRTTLALTPWRFYERKILSKPCAPLESPSRWFRQA